MLVWGWGRVPFLAVRGMAPATAPPTWNPFPAFILQANDTLTGLGGCMLRQGVHVLPMTPQGPSCCIFCPIILFLIGVFCRGSAAAPVPEQNGRRVQFTELVALRSKPGRESTNAVTCSFVT